MRKGGSPGSDAGVVRDVARRAGAAILQVYQGRIAVERKADNSPLTAADRASHAIITGALQESFPGIPVLSEEGRDVPWQIRREWRRLWVVDPLDGTKEFIKRNGEFTVNIALVEEGSPRLGVVHVPVQDRLFLGVVGKGAWVSEAGGPPVPISVRTPDPERGITVMRSRSHPSPELEAYLARFRVAESIAAGSSLKLCAVAEGRADLYPRLGPTMEWDTAAGQAVVEGAGGEVVTPDGTPLRYNKKDLHNPHFFVRRRVEGTPGKTPCTS